MASGRRFALAALLSKIVSAVHGEFTPTAPGPGQTFTAGGNCTIIWDVDESGSWRNVTIDLMSGSNTNMSLVTNVITGLDGTNSSLTPFNWTCPEVDPYSAIYFYQFTKDGQPSDAKWTTRFTIASQNNETVLPPNATQPNGDSIPWGIGHLLLNSSSTTNSTADNATVACDPANIAHFEQINVQDLHAKPAEDDDDGDDNDGSDDDDDKRHGSNDRDSGGDDDSSEGRGGDDQDSDDPHGHGKHDNKADEDDNGSNHHKGQDNNNDDDPGHEKDDEESSKKSKSGGSEDSESTRSTNRGGKTTSKGRPSPSASTKDSVADPSAIPTAALPPHASNAHSTSLTGSASGMKAASAPTASTAFVASPSGTCQCTSDTQGNLKLVSGDKRKVEMVPWVYAYPLLLALSILLCVLC